MRKKLAVLACIFNQQSYNRMGGKDRRTAQKLMTRQKQRNDFRKLSSDCHMCTRAHACPYSHHTYTHTHTHTRTHTFRQRERSHFVKFVAKRMGQEERQNDEEGEEIYLKCLLWKILMFLLCYFRKQSYRPVAFPPSAPARPQSGRPPGPPSDTLFFSQLFSLP